MRSIWPCSVSRAIPSSNSQFEWKLDFPGPVEEEAWIPHRNSRIPPQLKKNHVVHPSSKDEALSRYSVSREVPRSLLKSEKLLGTLDATPKVPRHTSLTWGEHRGSRHHFIWDSSPLLIATGGSIPLLCLEGIPDLPGAWWGQSHEEILDIASWVVRHAKRPQFPGPLLIWMIPSVFRIRIVITAGDA